MKIGIPDDFDPEKIRISGQCFRIRKTEEGWYRFITGKHVLHLREDMDGRFETDCDMDTWEEVWYPYFDLDRSYAQVRHDIPVSDPYMRKAAQAGQGIRILHQDPWEMLVSFIISQRKNIPAICSAVEDLSRRFGTETGTEFGPVWTFPDAGRMAQLSQEDLEECRLGYRTPYVMDAAAQVCSGTLDLKEAASLSDGDLLESLMRVKGVGKKVAGCIGLFGYQRTGLAPVDTWIRRVIEQEYAGKDPFPSYGNAAGILQQYVFYYTQTHKKEY